uniref:Adaptor protein, phosphotyrosine interaction, PH domain and leucine zipper containing 1 n=1 Tax=Tetraodon nigroviridis TaxID=99883 RepID=H3DLR9_TETNG
MPGIEKLPIEETLEDSPQTRSLLRVFEEDTAAVSDYCTQLYRAMQRIYDAQNELSAATHLTSRLLKEYDKQRFPLGGDDEVMSSTLQQFAKVIDELSSCQAVLSTQLADAMMFPVTQFKERDLKEILTLKEVFQISSHDHDVAVNRYSRLSKKRDNDKVRAEAVEDVYTSRKKQHQTMMHYFCSLNTLQYKKKMALLEPLLGYMQAQISFFKLGSENLTQQWEDFLATIGTSVQKNVSSREMEEEVRQMQQTIQDMERSCDPLYAPYEPDQNLSPVCRNLTQKQGYLHIRNKTGLVSSSWERQYFFTQGGNLMRQGRGEVAGSLLTDLDNSSVMAVDCDDRRFCFQVTSFDGKKTVTLQSESRKDCEEWIATINNISKRIYLSENAEQELAARVNQSALEAVTPSPSFQQRHESLRPGSRGVARASSISSAGSEPSPALSVLSLDALVAPDTPIQFDIISPVSEEHPGQNKTTAPSGIRRRSNSFGEAGDEAEDDEGSILHQLFIVRFLGCMEVKTAESADVISETMRQILAARAIHNIFRMTESHLLVTCDCLKLTDPQTQVTRLRFPLASVLQCSSHQDNKRLFGFVLQAAAAQGDTRAVCYIFESNNEGEKICDSVGLAKQIAFHSEMDRKAVCRSSSLDEVTGSGGGSGVFVSSVSGNDLEEQSRLIAASSRSSTQPGPDGQFLVLSSSQSEDGDAAEEGKKRKDES